MDNKLLFYRSGFITNAVIVILFIGLIMYNVFFKEHVSIKDNAALGAIIITVLAAIYLTNDIAGLALAKKLRKNESITKGSIIAAIIILCLIAIFQLFLAYGLYTGLKSIFRFYKDPFFIKIYLKLLVLYTLLTLIFITTTFNFIATMSLIKMAKSNQNEFDRQIEEIGSGN